MIDDAAWTFGNYVESRFRTYTKLLEALDAEAQQAKSSASGGRRSRTPSRKVNANQLRRKREERQRRLEAFYYTLATGERKPADHRVTKPATSLATVIREQGG